MHLEHSERPSRQHGDQHAARRAPPRDSGEPRWRHRAVLAVLVVVALLPLMPTLRAAFVYDDTTIIRDNVMLRGWSALARVWSAPYWPTQGVDASGLYRPLHVALLALIWNVSHGAPLPFHLYALASYAMVVVLVWRLLRLAT